MPNKSLGEQNYEQFAARYAAQVETKPHNAYYERPAMLSLLPDVRGQRVLDAGCGPGIYAEWLVEHGASVLAIDVTPDFVQITRERLGGRAEVLCADLNQPLAFAPDASFDLVLSPLVLDYLADWGPLFREFYRVLRSPGVLLFSASHPVDNYRLFPEGQHTQVVLERITWHGFGKPYPVIQFYRRPFSAMLNPLVEAGFRLDYVLEPQPTEKFRRANPADYARLMRLPGFLCIRARKV